MGVGSVWSTWWSSKSGRAADSPDEAPRSNVVSLNCLTEDVSVVPGTAPIVEHRRIDFYYADHDQVLIVGVADNNYIFWLSRTSLDDTDTNAAVFDVIAHAEPTLFGRMHEVVRKLGYRYEDLACLYRDSLTYVGGARPAPDDTAWQTPFGVRYVQSQERYNGSYFASGLRAFRAQLRRRCAFREADGAYVEIMRRYLEALQESCGDAVKDYENKRELIELIHSERYLLCSEHEAVRALYLKLNDRCASLYDAYMTVVR